MTSRIDRSIQDRVVEASARLDNWIEGQQFRGWDPFDALNSPLLFRLSFGRRQLGIGWVQILKRLPINLRPILGIGKGYNPKGMGLFLATYVRKYRSTGDPQHRERVLWVAEWLLNNATSGYHGLCWGYNFPWPNRSFYAPGGTPTAVNTAFIVDALLDAYEVLSDERYLRAARSACDFFLYDLNRLQDDSGLCFSYTPLDRTWVYNASILAAAALARMASITGEDELNETARRAADFVLARQRADGAWVYGESKHQGWVDSFHTGYILVALADLMTFWKEPLDNPPLRSGYRYYISHFFLPEGATRYYDQATYPIDVHACAQAILTFRRYSAFDPTAEQQAWQVASWTVQHMQAPAGYFYYQKHRRYTNRIAYMRWTQAWIQRAFAELCIE